MKFEQTEEIKKLKMLEELVTNFEIETEEEVEEMKQIRKEIIKNDFKRQ